MESNLDPRSKQLTISLSSLECRALANGATITNGDNLPHVEAHPLSEIDPNSRRIEPDEKPRERKRLGGLASRAAVMPSATIVYIPEALAQSLDQVSAEYITYGEITGDTKLRPLGGIRIELGEQQDLSSIDS